MIEDFVLIEDNNEDNNEANVSNEEYKPDIFDKYMKELKQQKKKDEFDPKSLDYIIGDKTSLRFDYIKNIKDEKTRINELAIFLKETYNLSFPDEFYEWIARDILGLKYKRWEIDDMKRQYRIKKKRELKKLEEERKRNKNNNKNNNNKKNKKKKKQQGMVKTVNTENPYVINF